MSDFSTSSPSNLQCSNYWRKRSSSGSSCNVKDEMEINNVNSVTDISSDSDVIFIESSTSAKLNSTIDLSSDEDELTLLRAKNDSADMIETIRNIDYETNLDLSFPLIDWNKANLDSDDSCQSFSDEVFLEVFPEKILHPIVKAEKEILSIHTKLPKIERSKQRFERESRVEELGALQAIHTGAEYLLHPMDIIIFIVTIPFAAILIYKYFDM